MPRTLETGRPGLPQPSVVPRPGHRSRVWPALCLLTAIAALNTLSLGLLAWRMAEQEPVRIQIVEVPACADVALEALAKQLFELELLLQEVEEQVLALD